jgi:uncharacterized protein
MGSIWLAFITGLTTGGISCITVQGGLLASSTKNKKEVGIFLLSKLAAYTLLGFLLGLLGSFFLITPKIQAVMQILIGIFLLGTAGRLANLHPVFRYFAIKPPKSLFKLVRKESAVESYFTPILTGALTILIPCGITQATMLVAIASGSALSGALIMFAFILGTSPVFFLVGTVASEMLKKKAFSYLAAAIVAAFGLISLNSAMALLGSNHTFQNYWRVITTGTIEKNSKSAATTNNKGVQEVTIFVRNNGYESDVNTLKVNVPVKLTLVTDNTYSCSRAFTIPALGISKVLQPNGREVIEFTPTKVGRLNFSCSMGMYTGSFNVTK